MSALRDVRLLIARHLDLPTNIRAAVLNTLNVLDAALDAEGWQEGDDVKKVLRELDAAVLGLEDNDDEPEDLFAEDEEDLVDIDDIEIISEDEDDEED